MYANEMQTLRELYRQGTYDQPFYACKLQGEENFDSYERFTQIPFMYKEDIRNANPLDRTTVQAKDFYGFFSSSGTTGKRTFYVYSNRDKEVHEEFVRTFFEELGVNETDLGGVFAPVDTGVMAHTMMWQFSTMGASYVNCPEPSPQNMIEFVTELPVTAIATRPTVVSSIAGIPAFEKAAQDSSVRMLLLGGGFLSEGRRKMLEKVWGADCYSMFGMSEVFGPMGGECRSKAGPHYLDKYLLIEVVDPKTHQPVQQGEYGVAVYTTLWNKGFPLLRYWTDDYIAVDTTPCGCGRALPRIHYKGRMADSLEINGTYVFPQMLEEILFKHGFIGEYRAVQKGGKITVTIEKIEGCSVSAELKQELDQLFMGGVDIALAGREELMYDGHAIRFTKENV